MVIEFTYDDDDGTQPLNAPETVTVNGVSFILGYDENGNMTDGYNFTSPASVLQRDIDFNSANMPLMVSNGAAQVDFSYDADSRRVLKTSTGSATLYFDTNFEVIGDTPTRYVFAGNLRIAKVTPNDVEYFQKDHLGSSTAMTGASGMENQVAAYLPFGMQRELDAITSTGYTFTDQELDAATGLYNYDARLYDPVIGRFLSADTVVPGSGFDPQMLNRFSYVRNNPLRFIDPSGHYVLGHPNDDMSYIEDAYDVPHNERGDYDYAKSYVAEGKRGHNYFTERDAPAEVYFGYNWEPEYFDFSEQLNPELIERPNSIRNFKRATMNMNASEFSAYSARLRQFIEMMDVANQGTMTSAVVFDILGWYATQIDIIQAQVPLTNKLSATGINVVGLGGIVGAAPTPSNISIGFAIDAEVYRRVNNLLTP